MKYAFLFLFLLISKNSFATIKSFNDSQSLIEISQFMQDNLEDLSVAYRISDKKLKLTQINNCTEVTADSIIKDVANAIKVELRRFPDEELPVEGAINDLKEYLGDQAFKKCIFDYQSYDHLNIHSIYYFNKENSVHVNVDIITLSP